MHDHPRIYRRPALADHEAALERIRQQMQLVSQEYAAGKINSAQFNAIYRHYAEKRTIIERLIARNPETDAWRTLDTPGQTTFLRQHFEARPIYFLVFRGREQRPLLTGGKLPPQAAPQIHNMLKVIWAMQQQRKGVARKSIGDGRWLVLALGDYSMTIVIFSLQPSSMQINRVRDLQADFERANDVALRRSLPPERMVFPQRALVENEA